MSDQSANDSVIDPAAESKDGRAVVPRPVIPVRFYSDEEAENDWRREEARRYWEQMHGSEPPPETEDGPEPAAEPVLVPPPWAYQRGLVALIRGHLKKVGIVGEAVNAFALYLIATSRIMAEPLCGLLMGASSAGKSFLLKRIYALMPDEEKIEATDITPQALFYLNFEIRNYFVAGGERCHKQDEHAAARTAAIRQLVSEGRLTKLVTERDGNRNVTRKVTVEGPIAHVESTTQKKAIVYPEDLNRRLILKMNSSPQM
jgi:hypothetical protein